jgi:hypothetical protein
LRPFVKQLLPPPVSLRDPAERLGIDVAALRTVEDVQRVFGTVLAALAQGEIAPREGLRIARRVRTRMRGLRRFARLCRSAATVKPAQRRLRPREDLPSLGGQIAAGTVDVEVHHRHRRSERPGPAPRAGLGRALQRAGDPLGVVCGKDPGFEIERIALLRNLGRPIFPVPRGAGRSPPRPRFVSTRRHVA